MKPLALISAAILSLATLASAQMSPETTSKPPTGGSTQAAAKTEKSGNMPMYSKVDSIDVAGKSLTHNTKMGIKVVHKVTASTVIMQGDKPAKFSDIKVGDYVSGTRLKKSATEYEIVKITKFGPKEEKKAEPKAPTKKP